MDAPKIPLCQGQSYINKENTATTEHEMFLILFRWMDKGSSICDVHKKIRFLAPLFPSVQTP